MEFHYIGNHDICDSKATVKQKREFYFKVIILLFNLFLLAGGAFLLFWFDVVDFDWSRKMKSDYHYSQSKSKEKRILIIGDSQLEPNVAKQSISKLMTAFCREHEIGIANAAHYGFGPNDYLGRMEEFVHDYHPDLVILFYNVHNDLTDVMLKSDNEKVEVLHGVFSEDEVDSLDRILASLREDTIDLSEPIEKAKASNNNEFDWVGFKEFGFDDEIIQFAKNRVNYPSAIGYQYVNPNVLVLAKWKPDFFMYNLSLSDDQSKYIWYKILKIFENMMEMCKSVNSKLAIVAVPSTLQVNDSHVAFYKRLKMTLLPEWKNSSLPQNLLDTFCTESNIIYLDVLPELRALSEKQELFYPNDDHLNDSGQTAIYRMVENKILRPYASGNKDSSGIVRPIKFYKTYNHWKRAYHVSEIEKRLGMGE